MNRLSLDIFLIYGQVLEVNDIEFDKSASALINAHFKTQQKDIMCRCPHLQLQNYKIFSSSLIVCVSIEILIIKTKVGMCVLID